MNLRLKAARVIQSVLSGQSLSALLPMALSTYQDPRDKALLQALCYGVCRYYEALDIILSYLLKKPMQAKDLDVYALILIGLYQLKYMRVPPHAAVSETVNATDALKKSWSKGFINAILREYLREERQIEEKLKTEEEAIYLHPAWWMKAVKKAWPLHWEKILESDNQHPPFSLRINQQRMSREAYLEKLRQVNISATAIPETQTGITLAAPIHVEDLPGFSKGEVSVQDGAAQLAATLLDLQKGNRVLDVCAAPGGKLTHILECERDLSECVAVEIDRNRMESIHENLKRARVQATCICSDANDLAAWWDGQFFDRILLDAPCSASGVLRRHPDIKLLRQPEDIKALAKTQRRLLETVWQTLAPGGKLIYATCSIFPEENTVVLKDFLLAHPEAKEEKMTVNWGEACEIGRQILTGQHNMDGFYYACLRK